MDYCDHCGEPEENGTENDDGEYLCQSCYEYWESEQG